MVQGFGSGQLPAGVNATDPKPGDPMGRTWGDWSGGNYFNATNQPKPSAPPAPEFNSPWGGMLGSGRMASGGAPQSIGMPGAAPLGSNPFAMTPPPQPAYHSPDQRALGTASDFDSRYWQTQQPNWMPPNPYANVEERPPLQFQAPIDTVTYPVGPAPTPDQMMRYGLTQSIEQQTQQDPGFQMDDMLTQLKRQQLDMEYKQKIAQHEMGVQQTKWKRMQDAWKQQMEAQAQAQMQQMVGPPPQALQGWNGFQGLRRQLLGPQMTEMQNPFQEIYRAKQAGKPVPQDAFQGGLFG